MKIYHFGAEDAPVLLLLPGTCCHWKSNFGAVIPLLADRFRVLCVSYDGFDETEQTEFPTMLEETEKIEAYLKTHCGGHIRAAYGCSLGGSFVGLLAARQNIHMDYGILGSSDLDQASPLTASLQTDFLLPLIYPVVRDGKIKAKFLQKRLDKCAKESGDYVKAFLKMFGDARPYVTINNEKVLLHDGRVLDIDGIKIECFLVPGHTWGHMVYLVDGKYLFTGDTIWFGADGGYSFISALAEDNKLAVKSLALLEKKLKKRGLHPLFITGHTGWTDNMEFAFAHRNELSSPFKKKVHDPNALYDAYDESDDTEEKAKSGYLKGVGR